MPLEHHNANCHPMQSADFAGIVASEFPRDCDLEGAAGSMKLDEITPQFSEVDRFPRLLGLTRSRDFGDFSRTSSKQDSIGADCAYTISPAAGMQRAASQGSATTVLSRSMASVASVPREIGLFLKFWFSVERFATETVKILEADVDGASEESQYRKHMPFFIVLQTAAAIVLYIVGTMRDESEDMSENPTPWFGRVGGLESFYPSMTSMRVTLDCKDERAEVWRWLTYQWTHVGAMHLAINSFINMWMGFTLEGFQGTPRMILMYQAGVLGGAIATIGFNNHIDMVGMSGGCYALLGTHWAYLVLNWSVKKYRYVELAMLLCIILADGWTLLNSDVAYSAVSAHAGGMAAGFIFGLYFGINLVRRTWERKLQFVSMSIGIALVVFCLVFGLQWAPRTLMDPVPYCWARQVFNPSLFGDKRWHCVRCADQVCIDSWALQTYVERVSLLLCLENGWNDTAAEMDLAFI